VGKKEGFSIAIKEGNEWIDGKIYFLELGIETEAHEKTCIIPFNDMKSVTRERGNTVIKYSVITDLNKELKEVIFKMDDREHEKIVIEYQKNKVPVEPVIKYDTYLEKQEKEIKTEMSNDSKMLLFRFILIIVGIVAFSLTSLIPIDGSNDVLKVYITQACISVSCLIIFFLSFKVKPE
jgi:hypothetical protein